MDFDEIPAANDDFSHQPPVIPPVNDNFFVEDDNEVDEVQYQNIDNNNQTYDFQYNEPVNQDNQQYNHQDALIIPEPVHEEDALTIFNKEWQVKLETKRAAEYEHEKQVRAKSQEDLQTWKTQRELRLNAKKDSNRTEEAVVKETFASEAGNIKVWDRASRLIDSSETVAVNTKGSDTTRMRKLFIQLKSEPLEATRAATA